jgi:hypothetical protein
VPSNAGWALAVLVVFQDLFIGAFFSGTLVMVIIFSFAHLSCCGSAILSRAVVSEILLCGTERMAGEQGFRGRPTDLVMTWRRDGPPEGANSLSAVGLRSLQRSRFRVLANDCRTARIEQL